MTARIFIIEFKRNKTRLHCVADSSFISYTLSFTQHQEMKLRYFSSPTQNAIQTEIRKTRPLLLNIEETTLSRVSKEPIYKTVSTLSNNRTKAEINQQFLKYMSNTEAKPFNHQSLLGIKKKKVNGFFKFFRSK